MIDILHRFLLQNRSISIPGLGTLHAERIPAKLSTDASQIIPPGYSFRFDKYFDAPDKAFFVYLSGRQGVPEYESMRLYNQFAQDFRSAIMLEERAEWPGIGYFRKNVSGEVEFVQTRPLDTGYAPVGLAHVDRTEPAAAEAPETDIQFSPVVVNETAPVSETISSVENASEGFDYPSTFEEETNTTASSNRVIMRIGWSIAAAASLLMILHFSQHGFTMKAAANNQTFQPARP
jgi:hypothetical protein